MTADYIHTHGAAEGEHYTTGDEAAAQPVIDANPDDATGESNTNDVIDAPNVVIENLDPYRRRVVNPFANVRRSFLGRLLRDLSAMLSPRQPTKEEIIAMGEAKQRALLEKTLAEDAAEAEREIVICLNNLGICHYIKESGDVRIKRSVRFDMVLTEPDAIHLHVNRRLPFSVSIAQLTDPITLDNLSHSVRRGIRCKYTPETGIWFTVERASGRAGIPNHVTYADIIERMPASASSLSIPMGYTYNRRPVYEDLGRMPHMLVGGATGAGKTNFLHGLICTLVTRNTPDNLLLNLVDLKGGVAFSKYTGLPHLQRPVIEKRDDVFSLLTWLIQEGETRLSTLRNAQAEDIGEYNAHRRGINRLPFIVVVIDEWADMMQTDKADAENALVNVVSRMRAVGIHVVLATQSPTSKVITGLIKINLPCRVAFSTPNNTGSMAIIDDASAAGLAPVGRCVMQFTKQFQIQTPYIPTELVKEIISDQRDGKRTLFDKRHDVTPRQVMEWALYENNGWLPSEKVYAQFKDRGIPQLELRGWLEEWEGNQFVIGSSVYVVEPGQGRRARRLVAVREERNNNE